MTAPWCSSPLKRGMDATSSGLLLIVLSPVMAVIAALVRLMMGRPVLFRQKRTGRDGATFTLYKFRTMTPEFDSTGREVPEGERITGLGRWLRRSSLDELPQLVHVLSGDMSVVGPRPLLPQYLDRYSPEQRRRLCVRPGLTGLAQTSGRNTLSWEDRFRLDIEYIEHASAALDATILARTVGKVLRFEGISSAGHPTIAEFLGSSEHAEALAPSGFTKGSLTGDGGGKPA